MESLIKVIKLHFNVKLYPAWKPPTNLDIIMDEWVEIPTCDVTFNNDYIDPNLTLPGQSQIDNIVSTEMMEK